MSTQDIIEDRGYLPSPEELLEERDKKILNFAIGTRVPFDIPHRLLEENDLDDYGIMPTVAKLRYAGYIEVKKNNPIIGPFFDFASDLIKEELMVVCGIEYPSDTDWDRLDNRQKASIFMIFRYYPSFKPIPLLGEFDEDILRDLYRMGFLEGSFITNQFELVLEKLPEWMVHSKSCL